VKRIIYGKSGFEIVVDKDPIPERLLPLESTSLKPKLTDYRGLSPQVVGSNPIPRTTAKFHFSRSRS